MFPKKINWDLLVVVVVVVNFVVIIAYTLNPIAVKVIALTRTASVIMAGFKYGDAFAGLLPVFGLMKFMRFILMLFYHRDGLLNDGFIWIKRTVDIGCRENRLRLIEWSYLIESCCWTYIIIHWKILEETMIRFEHIYPSFHSTWDFCRGVSVFGTKPICIDWNLAMYNNFSFQDEYEQKHDERRSIYTNVYIAFFT